MPRFLLTACHRAPKSDRLRESQKCSSVCFLLRSKRKKIRKRIIRRKSTFADQDKHFSIIYEDPLKVTTKLYREVLKSTYHG